MTLNLFTFKRKKTNEVYQALQFATPVPTVGQRGKSKGKTLIKADISEYLKMSEAQIREIFKTHDLDIRAALILGGSKLLRIKAAQGGMVQVLINRLESDKYQTELAGDARQRKLKETAGAILNLFKAKNGKLTLDACYDFVIN